MTHPATSTYCLYCGHPITLNDMRNRWVFATKHPRPGDVVCPKSPSPVRGMQWHEPVEFSPAG